MSAQIFDRLKEVPRDPKDQKCLRQSAGEFIVAASGDEDPTREGLARTPARFAKAMDHLLSGYELTVKEAVGEGVFAAEGRGLVTVESIEFYSLCEHHLLPFWGSVSVAYFPKDKILGLSKIPRIVDIFARRLQVQERFTRQVADAIREAVDPRAVAVRAKASHLCMMMRGVEKQNSFTSTEVQYGVETLSPVEQARFWSGLGP